MQSPDSRSTKRCTVQVDRGLEDIVPGFLANRQKDLQTVRRALLEQDFETITLLAHRMKGDGGGYGFDRITEIGGDMELAASRHDCTAVERYTAELEEFLLGVTIVYV